MRKIFALILAISGLTAYSQQLEKSLLWEISGNKLEKPSYLFGTIHITCDATLQPKVLKALDATDRLYLELDMDDPALQSQMMMGMMMKDGKTLSSLISEEDFKLLDEYVTQKMGFSAKMINTVKPLLVSSMLIPSMLDCPMQSVEAELMKVTKEQEEEILGLEDVQDQLALFDAVPYETQMKELVKSIKESQGEENSPLDKLMELYKNEDLEGMLKESSSTESFMAEFQDVMLDKRNQNWIPVMEKAMKEKPTFFGVGAAHLAGEKGVINLLRKAGYTVKAVK